MRMMIAAATMTAALALTSPAQAEDMQGKVQVKLLGTAVLPNGELTELNTNLVGAPATTTTEANDNYVPTVAIEYFFTNNISLETICCMTQHDVDATGPAAIAGGELVADAKIIPATFTLKYHFGDHSTVTPYVGVGPTYFITVADKPGTLSKTLGATSFTLDNAFGVAVQAGVDIPLGESGPLISFDAKRYFVSADAHWYAGNVEALATRHKLDPWVLSAGVGFAF